MENLEIKYEEFIGHLVNIAQNGSDKDFDEVSGFLKRSNATDALDNLRIVRHLKKNSQFSEYVYQLTK